MSFNLPLLMVIAFLGCTLAVGLYYSKKTTTLREYAIGNKNFSTTTLVATILATAYGGGGLVRHVEQVHNFGLYWVLRSLLVGFNLWIVSLLASRMAPFMQNLSMAETIGSVYGKHPRMVTALSNICASVAGLAIQVNVMAMAIGMCMENVNPKVVAAVATFFLIFYSTFGGIRAVTFTDILQFATFCIIIPLLTWFVFAKINKPLAEIIPILQNHDKFRLSTVLHWDMKLIAMISLLLAGLMSALDPPLMQRVYMSSGPIQAKKAFFYSTVFAWIIKIQILLIGVFVFVNVPELDVKEVWKYIVESLHPIFKGLLAISLLAMTMSTADSKLNSCSVMVSHDLVESLRGKKADNPLQLARWSSFMLGLFGMFLTFYSNDLLELLRLGFAFIIPITTAPLLLAILGFRGSSRTALMGMTTGAVAIVVWNTWVVPVTGIDGSFICMIANGLVMLAAHYFLPQPLGTGWIRPNQEFQTRKEAAARASVRRKKV